MRIHHNAGALFAWRSFSDVDIQLQTSISKLSSGQRVRSAEDDAAGLGISQKFRAQYLGFAQATRNALDGLNLVNTGDYALGEIISLVQRGRELSVLATNGVFDSAQKSSIQTEVNHLLEEIDRIAESTVFNGRQLFTTGNSSAISGALLGLRSGWLEQAERIISTKYGITGDGSRINILLGRNSAQELWIRGTPDPLDGKLQDITLRFDVEALNQDPNPDRIVARALTQAVLARNSNYVSLNQWFISGASDFVAGGDELLQAAVANYGAASIVNGLTVPWADDSLHRASAYVAVKYLNTQLTAVGALMSDVMDYVQIGADVGSALSSTLGVSLASFLADFQFNGGTYLNNLITSGALSDADVGGINPGDASAVIPDGGTYSVNPTSGFTVGWQYGAAGSQEIRLQVGPKARDWLTFTLPQVDTTSLDLVGLNLVKNAADAIERFGKAVTIASSARIHLGSVGNGLEHTINANMQAELSSRSSFSRIVDVDFADEVTKLMKQQLLASSSGMVLARANHLRDHVVWLLNGLSGPTPPK